MPVLQPVQPANQQQQSIKKVNRKSSKPIFHWLQKKLGGAPRPTRRASVDVVPPNATQKVARHTLQQQQQQKQHPEEVDLTEHDNFVKPSSASLVSSWRNSNTMEADEDASIRPIPPTSPPSPVPSRSSSSFVSDPRTFKSTGGVSTKATTLLSIDMGTNGMAHIAQAPSTPSSLHNYNPTPGSAIVRVSSPRTSLSLPSSNPASNNNNNSVTFSALPPNSPPNPSSSNNRLSGVQAPLHTQHHPRNNPRPSSPPLDDASILTLASSAYATAPRFGWGADSQSQIAVDSASHAALDELQLEERDISASVRALRPRSRRGSWDSEVSGWSASSPLAPDKSVRTAPSVRTNGWRPTGDETDGGDEDASSSLKQVVPSESVEEHESEVEDHGTPAVRSQSLA